jgi:phenylacetate-CoA ligase
MPLLLRLYERLERRHVSRHYDEFKRDERKSRTELEAIQLDKLRRLVRHAHDSVPFYRERFERVGFHPDALVALDDLKRLPLVSKEDLKAHFDRMISSAYDRSRLVEYATGGSTGQPTRFLMTREQYDARAAVEVKSYEMTGWRFLCRTFLLSGAPVHTTGWSRLKESVRSFLLGRRRISTFDLSDDKLRRIHELVERGRPEVIFGYVSTLVLFARWLAAHGLRVRVPVIIQMAEMVHPDEIALIEDRLGGTFYRHYGARDAISMGIECRARRGLHVNMDTLVVEILRDGKEAFDADGEVHVTDLYSYGMPLIRYRMGDVGRWLGRRCTCGRDTPLFEITQGRSTSIVSTRDGRFAPGTLFPHLFKEASDRIERYEVYQPDLDRLIVRVVRRPGWDGAAEDFLRSKLREQLGDRIDIRFEYPDSIAPLASGKFQAVRSDVPVDFGNR